MGNHLFVRSVEASFRLAAVLSATVIVGVLTFLVYFSSPLFTLDGLAGLFSWEWLPHEEGFGILPMVTGSLLLSVLALTIAFPAAVGICVFAEGIGPGPLGRFLIRLVHFMTSIPTVVYAFVSAVVLVPFTRGFFGYGSGYSLLTATLVLGVLILPTIVLLIEAHWRGIVPRLLLTGSSLGLTPRQILFRVVIPVSRSGLAVAAVLGFGRAIGDTLISLMLAGNAPIVPETMLDPIRTLTAHIAFGLEADTTSPAYYSVFASGLLLVLITSAINLAVSRMSAPDARGAQ